jgi:hypothetical protein
MGSALTILAFALSIGGTLRGSDVEQPALQWPDEI